MNKHNKTEADSVREKQGKGMWGKELGGTNFQL